MSSPGSQKQNRLSKQNKTFFLVSQVLPFRDTNQTSKNVVDTTLNSYEMKHIVNRSCKI